MAEQVTLGTFNTLQNSSIISTLNANNTLIEDAFEDCVSLSGTQPNAMQANLDMNSNQIINLPAPSTVNSPVRLKDIQNPIVGTIPINLLPDIVTPQQYGAIGNGVADDTAAVLAAEAARQSGGTLYWPAGTYKLTADINITKPGNWNLDGITINSNVGRILIKSSNFSLNGNGSTFNFTAGDPLQSLNRAIRLIANSGNGVYSTDGQAAAGEYLVTGSIAVNATSFVAARSQDAAHVSANDWILVVLKDTSNWVRAEFKQVVSVTGSTTINVETPFGQAFSNATFQVCWVKISNPLQNINIDNLNINATAIVSGGNVVIDCQPGVIDLAIKGCIINTDGIGVYMESAINPRFYDNDINTETSRHTEISVTQGGRFSRNTYRGSTNQPGPTINTGSYACIFDNNILFGRTGPGIVVLNDVNAIKLLNNIYIGGTTPGTSIGIFGQGLSNCSIIGETFIGCGQGITIEADAALTLGTLQSNNNLIANCIIRNATTGVLVLGATTTGTQIIGLDTDSSVTTPFIDSGTNTVIFRKTSSGFNINATDSNSMLLLSGATHGLRMGVDSSNSYVEGVDSAGGGSYQPLVVNGSTVDIRNSNTSKILVGSGTATFATPLITTASATSSSGFRLPAGTAPTSPVDGDMWYDGTNLKVRLVGVTKTVTVS